MAQIALVWVALSSLSPALDMDLVTKKPLLWCNSPGPLYAISSHFGDSAATSYSALVATCVSPNLWHHRLGNPSSTVLASLVQFSHSSILPSEPSSFMEVSKCPHWRRAMTDDYNFVMANCTWT
ncbi:hypothetical protein HAX54_017233 [Datura stramonium]|uniref:Uncharacterized protein n=1 Tax=Datura stramonium TaxID=4076 RepID=A0ABS8UKA4_DATST|nr:hypothetical protein [Datura stramonium]